MRVLQSKEVNAVSGAGLIGSVLGTTVRAGAAVGKGLVQATTIVAKPLVSTTVNVLRFLI